MNPAYLRPGLAAPLWRGVLRLLGWRLEFNLPAVSKYIIVVAPHTSNWDFVIGILAAWAIGLPRPRWVGKHTLFNPPLGWIMRAWGGIPVDRRKSQNFVQQVADHIAAEDIFLMGIAPEGTRARTQYWRSGFYYIAHTAGVPIVLAYLDFERKVVGNGPVFEPSGDIEADFEIIRAFYGPIRGKNPHLQGEIRIRPRTDEGRPADAEAG